MRSRERQRLVAQGIDPRLYTAWVEARHRCNNPFGKDYFNYGGRGIRVCGRWDSYAAFAADMGPHPGKGWTLDRQHVNGNYDRHNCRWATRKTQVRNRRCTKLTPQRVRDILHQYQSDVSQSQIAVQFGICQQTVSEVVRGKIWI